MLSQISRARSREARYSGFYVARYFFHLRDGSERLLDPQGVAIDDPGRIAEVALKEARTLILQEALQGAINLDQRLEVEDAKGSLVHSLRFSDAVHIRRDASE